MVKNRSGRSSRLDVASQAWSTPQSGISSWKESRGPLRNGTGMRNEDVMLFGLPKKVRKDALLIAAFGGGK